MGRSISRPRPFQLPLQMPAHGRPFRRDDRIDAGIPQVPVTAAHVAAKDSVELGAEALYGAAALDVEDVGAEFDGQATERFERVGEKHQLALGVDRAAPVSYTHLRAH